MVQATEKGHATTPRILLLRVGFHDDEMDYVLFLGLNGWSDMDTSIFEVFEKTHSEGSWDLFLEQVGEGINSSYEERWVHMPHLSGLQSGG